VPLKKLLLLGGSIQQISAIKYARQQGYYTILCDYLSDNPGQSFADEYHNVSTTDKEAILQIAVEKNIDGIVAYASDPAAPTAAYVGNKLDLPSNPYESVRILTRKDLFRKFLSENNLNCPQAISFCAKNDIEGQLSGFAFPLIIKPVDSSGSKGVCKVQSQAELEEVFDYSLSYSREKRVIVEEFIEMDHECMIGGDIFVINGKLEFCGLLNSHRDPQVSPYVPIGTSYPVFINDQKIEAVKKEIQKILDLLHIKSGALNLEFMFGKNGKLYPIELGPRNGGNMIPELLHMTHSFDSIRATVECALGNNTIQAGKPIRDLFLSTYVIHSAKSGYLKEIIYHDDIEKNIFKKIIYKKEGDYVEKFNGANKALDIVFLQYPNLEELQYKMRYMNQYIKVQVW